MITAAALSAAALAGLTGGVHCAQMCGPIVLGLNGRRCIRLVPASPSGATAASVPIPLGRSIHSQAWPVEQAGRIASYTLLGGVFGSLGRFTEMVHQWMPLQAIAFFLFNLTIVILGLQIAGLWAHVSLPKILVRPLGQLHQPLLARVWPPHGNPQRVLCGLGWGLLPCGLIYTVLPLALLSGSPWDGALLMLSFGLGTLPMLLLIGWSGSTLGQRIRQMQSPGSTTLRRLAGVTIIVWGLWGLLHASQLYFRPAALLLNWCAAG